VVYEGNSVNVVISGHGQPPVFARLVEDLRARLGQPVIVTLKIVPAEQLVSP
jgi:hypothetical protein